MYIYVNTQHHTTNTNTGAPLLDQAQTLKRGYSCRHTQAHTPCSPLTQNTLGVCIFYICIRTHAHTSVCIYICICICAPLVRGVLPGGLGCTPAFQGYIVCEPIGRGVVEIVSPFCFTGYGSESEFPEVQGSAGKHAMPLRRVAARILSQKDIACLA